MSDLAVRFEHVGKMYKAFGSKLDNLLDALSLPNFRGKRRYREFWALRDIDLELPRGGRLGIIGRNGAGKSTLLKLITGNVLPSEGHLSVTGNVQALLEIGGGLHPEFTGRENIHAALGYYGLSRAELDEAERDIAEFTELGRFLGQPFRTYSQGMQARLSFGIATTVQPEILIVDEILGAGDAYFFARSTGRMRRLIDGGATVLLVSHALDQIVRFCDETIWLDRGRIVMRGNSIDVVKAYERFVRELDAKRLLAVNRKASSGQFDAFEREGYTDSIVVELSSPGAGCDVRSVSLYRDGALEDAVAVGDAQDADLGQSAAVVADAGWSPPQREGATFFRRVTETPASSEFQLWFFYPMSEYAVDVAYRSPDGPARAEVRLPGAPPVSFNLPASGGWTTCRLDLPRSAQRAEADQAGRDSTPRQPPGVSRWPGEGSLSIDKVRLVDGDGNDCALFGPDTVMSLRVRVRAHREGSFALIPAATLYRADGILVSNHAGIPLELHLDECGTRELRLDFAPLPLGDGRYMFSVGLYRRLSRLDSEVYDLIDRSYEFEIAGNREFDDGVCRLSAAWTLADSPQHANTAAG